MTQQWLLADIKKLMQHRNRVVLLDPSGQCSFMMSILQQQNIQVLQTNSGITEQWQQEKEELLMRHQAETEYYGKPLVFYVTRPQEKLSFLFDYCFTHGSLDLSNLQEWLKKKIFTETQLQVSLDNPMLLTAAKLGIGKDLAWWKKIVQNLEDIINLDDELLPFVDKPEAYMAEKDADVRQLIEEKLHHLLGQPVMPKPAATLAKELVKKMFDGLLANDISEPLLSLYYKWADSASFRPSLEEYIRGYQINSANPWMAHPEHCFEKLDKLALKQIAENIRDKSFFQEKLEKLGGRIRSQRAGLFIPGWWQDVSVLLNADPEPLGQCQNLNALISHYTSSFCKIDRAIRNLYEAFLNDEAIIKPLQEHYESLNHLLLQTWFGFSNSFKTTQQGYLPRLFASAKPRTAVIVGDGLRYEIADYVAWKLEKNFKVDKQVMLADMPSETEHNMSALYVGNGQVLAQHKDRESSLEQATGKPIAFKQLEEVNYGMEADYLVLTYKDIDKAGETMQMAAIKLFGEFEKVLSEKIELLLNIGYQEVHLITDHGFVLTGLLEESDKIDPSVVSGKKEVHERFVRTEERQNQSEWLAFNAPHGEFQFVYAAKSHRPFKSRGTYGFSHGGFTPQEIIIPAFRFYRQKSQTSQLRVYISNSADLANVTGELFVIRLDAPDRASDLFGNSRKVQIKLFAGSAEIQCSDVVKIEANSIIDKEFSFHGNTQLQAVLLDANTQEQLDTVMIKKSNTRDLGGLL